MGESPKGNNMDDKKCSKKCIHHGRKHPCVFCVRDPANEDHYKESGK